MKEIKNKAVKKSIRDDIESGLIKQLKTLTDKFSNVSEKLDQKIKEGAKKLAKKISKEIEINEEQPTAEPVKKTKTVKVVKEPVPEEKPVKAVAKAAPRKKKV